MANHRQIEDLFQRTWRSRASASNKLFYEAKNKNEPWIAKNSQKFALLTEEKDFNRKLLDLITLTKASFWQKFVDLLQKR